MAILKFSLAPPPILSAYSNLSLVLEVTQLRRSKIKTRYVFICFEYTTAHLSTNLSFSCLELQTV